MSDVTQNPCDRWTVTPEGRLCLDGCTFHAWSPAKRDATAAATALLALARTAPWPPEDLPDGVFRSPDGRMWLLPDAPLPDGWEWRPTSKDSFVSTSGVLSRVSAYEVRPALPATETIDTLSAYGRLLPDGTRISGVSQSDMGKWYLVRGASTFADTVTVLAVDQ